MVMVETDKNQAYLKLDDAHVNPVLARSARIVAERAQGSFIYDMNGDAYLDFATGIAVQSNNAVAAQAFISFLNDPQNVALWKANGLIPLGH